MSKVEKFSRIIIKRSNISGIEPTIPQSGVTSYDDHTLSPLWKTSDIYVGEYFLNKKDERLWLRTNENNIREIVFSDDLTDMLILTDVVTSSKYQVIMSGGTLTTIEII